MPSTPQGRAEVRKLQAEIDAQKARKEAATKNLKVLRTKLSHARGK